MASTLRTLAKAYANNQIEKNKYRHDRTAYVEAIISGKLSIQQDQAASLSSTFSGSRANLGFDKASPSAGSAYISTDDNGGAANYTQPGKTGLIIAAGASLIVIAVIFAIPDKKQEQQTSAGTETVANTTVQIDSPPSAAQTLVRSFLDSNIWSQASMDNFLMEWNRLADADRTAIKNSIELGQITNAIYKKLLEEKALSGIGNPETSYEKQRILVQFASGIGIDDPRISLPEQAATTTP